MGSIVKHQTVMNKISNYNNIIWVEIGVWKGNGPQQILEKFNDHIKKMYLIDPYKPLDYLHRYFGTQEKMNRYKNEAHNKLDKYNKKIKWIEDFSDNAYKKFKKNYIDILYIDGNHSYESVLNDLNNFYPKVKDGGLIIGDDYNEADTKQAADQFAEENDIELEVTHSGDTNMFHFEK